MKREIILRFSVATGTLSLLLLPLAAHSSRLQSSEPNAISSIVHAASFPPAANIPAISVSRDPFVPLAGAGKTSQTEITIVVRAIALGAQPAALVDENGKTRLVTPGDSIVGSRVNAITAQDITLADGRHFALPVQQ